MRTDYTGARLTRTIDRLDAGRRETGNRETGGGGHGHDRKPRPQCRSCHCRTDAAMWRAQDGLCGACRMARGLPIVGAK